MTQIPLLQDILVIFGVAIAVLVVCHRVKIPPIVGYLLTGVLIGPYGLKFVSSVHEVEALAEIGIILLLFTIGIEFSFRELLRARKAVLLGGTLQVVCTIAATHLVMWYLGEGRTEAVFMGFLIALSSTAIVLRGLQERAEITTPHGRVILSVLIFQDIVIIPMMIFTPLMAEGSGDITGTLLTLLAKVVLIIGLVILGARYVVPNLLFQITRTRSRELFLLAIVVICMAVAWGTNTLGLSLGLGAFLAGLIISDSEYSHQALEGVLPFKDVFNSFFFVSVGMLLDTSFLISQPLLIIGVTVAVYAAKSLIAGGVSLLLGLSARSAVIAGLSLGQVGEFSFILSRVGVEYGLLQGDTYQTFIAVSIFSMAATPFVTILSPRVADAVSNWPFFRRFKDGAYRGLAGETSNGTASLRDHLVIIGFGVNGQNIARVARSASIPYVIVEMNPDTVKQCRQQGEPISYGDATSAAVLDQAHVSDARVVVVAISDPSATRNIAAAVRKRSERLRLIVRTRFVAEVGPLEVLGADEVIPEEFETSVEIFTRVLSHYLVPRDEIERFTREVRSRSYEMLRSRSVVQPTLGDLQLSIPELRIESVRVPEASAVVDRSLAQIDLRAQCGVTLVAIARNGKVIANPSGSDHLRANDLLYLLGPSEAITRAESLVTGRAEERED